MNHIPQSSNFCNYNPHNIECRKLGEFKLIETDTGKEFYVCSEHIQGYRYLNERYGREYFVIVKLATAHSQREQAPAPPSLKQIERRLGEGYISTEEALKIVRAAYDCGKSEASSARSQAAREIADLIHQVGKLAEKEGDGWRIQHAELMDAYQAATELLK